ncbi:AraC family transcriptional regulator [Hydrogenispora ethanolica]|uniref:AraC family transcriptional regulator n=1 Tax=Hydrogenispora ethanolica TaxID=1082276 RepID=A0A4R1RA20_HYDET|nr:AraC family transcriptional regulator [Hydrogenispora ethanolica]TCL62555.1 AraC family transcriptional regulator [Hydrogenispora ethanolica]
MSLQTLESMVQWLDNHALENPTLERMSSHVGYSPYYCSTKFREYTGVTYKRYLAKCRLHAAANLLLRTDDKIIEIALQCGYSSAESLSRAFMEVYQCTPTQYRKAQIG